MRPILDLLSSAAWQHLVFALLHSLWIGVLWAGALAVGLWFSGRNASLRYGLALGSLAGLAASTLLLWAVYETDWTGHNASRGTEPQRKASPAMAHEITAREASMARAGDGPPQPSPWVAVTALLWLTGVAAMMVRLSSQTLDSARRQQEGTPIREASIVRMVQELQGRLGLKRAVRLVSSAAARIPSAAGILAPVIILPCAMLAGVPDVSLQAVLAHELAHIRRHDYLVNLVQRLIEALLFFNPAVWWINRQIRLEREACCDALAVGVSSEPGEYAALLAGFAEYAHSAGRSVGSAFPGDRQPSALLERMRRLLVPGHRPTVRLPWPSFLAVTAISAMSLLGAWRGSIFAMAVAAEILTPEQRITRIAEIRAAQGPEEREYTAKDNVKISGRVRTWDGGPLPEGIQIHVHVSNPRSSFGFGSLPLTNGVFYRELPYGTLFISSGSERGYGPALVGPLTTAPGGSLTNIEIVLPKGFTSVIRVVDPAGQPLGGVELQGLYRHPPGWISLKGATDRRGEASFSNCVSAPMRWTALLHGFQEAGREEVRFKDNQPIVWKLEPARTTTGEVVSRQGGLGIPGARIKLIHRDGLLAITTAELDSARTLAITDGRGTFRLDSLPDGISHVIAVEAEGFATSLVRDVVAGGTPLRIALGPEISVEGEIQGDLAALGGTSEPFIEAAMPIEFGHSSTVHSMRVPVTIRDGVGRFSIRNLREGTLLLTVGGTTREYAIRESMRHLVIQLEAEKKPAVAASRREVLVRFDVPPGMPRVRGRLKVYAHGEGVEGTNLVVPVSNGEARFTAPAPGWVSYTSEGLIGYWVPEKSALQISPGSSPLLDNSQALPAGAIIGNVRNPDGSETSGGVLVSVIEAHPAPGRGSGPLGDLGKRSASDGEGPARFMAQPLPIGGEYVIVAFRREQYIASEPIRLTEEAPIRELDLRFVEGSDLTLTVTDEAGKPKSGVTVALVYQTPYGHGFRISGSGGQDGALSDSEGRARFKGLNPKLPGSYTAIIDGAPGYQPLNQEVSFDRPTRLALSPGATLSGIVVNSDSGNALAEAEIFAIPAKVEPGEASHFIDADSKSDSAGRFTFSKLAHRPYRILCRQGQIINGRNDVLIIQPQRKDPLVVRLRPNQGARLWELGNPTR